MTEQVSSNRTVIGKVVSDKSKNTIVVKIERTVKHPLYGKYIQRSSKVCAHDADETSRIGDVVVLQQSRPISKTKHWVLVKILEQADRTETE